MAAATLATGYIIYRCIRMVPSLAPPLWWTIPANAVRRNLRETPTTAVNPDLDAILATRERSGSIVHSDVVEWMRSDDIEVLGALYHLITDRRFSSRIEPPLSFDEYQSFAQHYFGRCLRENPAGAWSNSRYSAGWDLVNWIASLWKDKHHRNAVDRWKSWLAEMYKEGDDALRTCIVTATLEHLFEQRGMKKYFLDWKADPILARAYDEAAEWVDRGGRTDLASESR